MVPIPNADRAGVKTFANIVDILCEVVIGTVSLVDEETLIDAGSIKRYGNEKERSY